MGGPNVITKEGGRRVRIRERLEDAVLLALKMEEEGPIGQDMRQLLELRKGKKQILSECLQKKHSLTGPFRLPNFRIVR